MALAEEGFAVVGDHVELGGCAEALSVLIDDGWEVDAGAVVANGDVGVAHVSGGFVTNGVEAKRVVCADLAGAFKEEEFVAVRTVGEVADVVEIEAEAVDGFHAKGGVFTIVVGGLNPLAKLGVELLEIPDVAQVANEELIAHGAEEAFDFSLGSAVSNRCVDEDGAEAGADEAEFFG